MALIKVLLGFKTTRLNEITKEVSVTREKKRYSTESQDTLPSK